jgi:hypothetical protein
MKFHSLRFLLLATVASLVTLFDIPVPEAINSFMLMMPMIAGIIMLPLMLLQLPVMLDSIPRPILKLLCFVPTGAAGFFVVKIWLLQNYPLAAATTLLFCIILYGSFTLKEFISR